MRYLSNLLLGVFLVVPAFIWADDPNENILLVFGDWDAWRESGDVVVTVNGAVKGDGVFPAVSSDHQLIAILHVENPHDRSVFLKIVSIDDRNVVEQFELVLADERREALNADDRDTALTAFEDRIRNKLTFANQYLSQNEFYSVPELYDIRHTFAYDYFSPEDYERPRISETEVGVWIINYNHGEEMLKVSSATTGGIALRIKQPIEVYGMARPGALCRVRPTPYQGWYDEESDIAIIRLGYFYGGHGCDVSDKWLIERLESP